MISWRKTHRIVALVATLPLVVITVTGIVLQLRNQFEFIQPALVKTTPVDHLPLMTLERVIERFEAEEIEQIIYRPKKGSLVVRVKSEQEIQLHPQTGEILKSAPRRTGFLIHLHQGSFFGNFGQYFVYFLGSLGLCYLIISGIFIYPFKRKRT